MYQCEINIRNEISIFEQNDEKSSFYFASIAFYRSDFRVIKMQFG